MRYVIIENGIVVNVVEWDGQAQWAPPPGTTAERSDTLDIGDAVED
jgi:hypothetical protein